MHLPIEWAETLRRLRRVFPEAVIAGGALRDHLLDRPVKDVDFWVKSDRASTQDLLQRAFDRRVTETHLTNSEYPGNLSAVYGVAETNYQIIALNDPVNLDVVDIFDFGICMIATDGERDNITARFIRDLSHKTFTLYTPETLERSTARFVRLEEKYRGWKLVTP